MRKNRQIRILLIASILLTLISTSVTYINLLRKKESTELVIHTYEVIQSTTRLLTLIQDQETGQRGYLLTNDSSFLTPYHTAEVDLDSDIAHLKDIVSYNPRQTDVLTKKLIPLLSQKKQNMATSLDILQQFGHDSASHFVDMRLGKTLMDSIRFWVNDFKAYEEQLLISRNEDLQQAYFIGNVIYFSSFTLIGLTSLFALFTIRNKERVNERLMLHSRELNRSLEQKVKERTRQLEEEKNHSDQLNTELQQNLHEIRSLHDALVEANKRLLKLNEEKDHFLGITTHDLKTPLVGISSLLQLLHLDGQNLKVNQQEYVRLMQDACQKMNRLITDLLDINRIEQGITPVKKKVISIKELISNLQKQFATWSEEKNIALKFQNQFTADTITTDGDILQRILDNLISNALKFSSSGKEVIVELTEKNAELVIKVMDDGPGINEEEMPLMFGKFQKLSAKPTANESSSGLGLSIVKEFVQLLDGTIRVESIPGKGALFTVLLPL